MFCPKCGTDNPAGAMSCAKCGGPLAAQPQAPGAQPPAQQQYGGVQPPAAAQSYSGQAVAAIQNYMTHNIIMTVVSTLACCNIVSLALAIVGIVFASNSKKAAAQGDVNGAQSAANTAKILFFISLGLVILFLVGGILRVVLGGGLQALQQFHHFR